MQLTTPFKFHAIIRLVRLRQSQFLCNDDQNTLLHQIQQSVSQVRCFKFQGFYG